MITVMHIAESAYGGGAESVFRDTILKLKCTDITNNHIVACVAKGNEPFKVDINFEKKYTSKLEQIFSFSNYKVLKEALFITKPNIVHIQNYGNLSPSILKAVYNYKQKYNKVKIIQTVHTYEHVCSHYAAFDYKKNKRCLDCANNRFKLKIFYRGCSRLGYIHSWAKGITSLIASYYISKNLFDLYLTPSNFLRQCMLQGKLGSSIISVLRNPMNENFLKQNFDKFSKNSHPFEFVYFGRFSEEKNLDVLIKGFKILLTNGKKAKLTLIGKGDKKDTLISMCENLGITRDVEFIEFLQSDKLIERLKKAHVSIIPSKCFETASLVINEAVVCGMVPIVSNHGAMQETLQILDVGLAFNSESSDDLATKLNEVMANYSLYFNQLSTSFNVLKKVYNYDTYINGLMNIYDMEAS